MSVSTGTLPRPASWPQSVKMDDCPAAEVLSQSTGDNKEAITAVTLPAITEVSDFHDSSLQHDKEIYLNNEIRAISDDDMTIHVILDDAGRCDTRSPLIHSKPSLVIDESHEEQGLRQTLRAEMKAPYVQATNEESVAITTATEHSFGDTTPSPQQGDRTAEAKYKRIHFHRDGDMLVRVKDERGSIIFYEVVSACLAAASPVWRQIIYGGAQSRPLSGLWVLGMLEDNYFALFILFKLIHYHYYDLPQRQDVRRFYNLCTVAEKYACTHLFVPYIKEWISDLNWHIIMANGHNDDDKTLWITWIFGDPKWFSKMLNKASCSTSIDKNGNLRNSSGQLWKESPLPAEVLGLVAKARERGLKDIMTAVNAAVLKLMLKKPDGHAFCRAKEQQSECEAMILGSSIKSLVQADLWPFPSPASYLGSIRVLADVLLTLNVQHFVVPGVRPHQDSHGLCGLGHREANLAALDTPVRLSGHVAWRLKQQAIKSGAYDTEKFKEYHSLDGVEPENLGHVREFQVPTVLEEDESTWPVEGE